MSTNRRPIVTALLATGVALLVAALLITATELALRALFPGKATVATGRAVLDADPLLIYRLRPNVRAAYQRSPFNGGQLITWTTNAEGYRGRPLRAHPRVRVAVYGDSNIQAAFSADDNTFAVRLERLLADATHADVEVINGGVLGYGPDQSLRRMARDLPVLKPDVVVFHVFADNDFGDLLRNRLYTVSDGALHEHPSPYHYVERGRVERLQDFAASLLLTRALGKVLGKLLPQRADDDAHQRPAPDAAAFATELADLTRREWDNYRSGGRDTVQVDHYDLELVLHPDSEPGRTERALMQAVIAAARDSAAHAGAAFVVLIEPSAIDLTTNLPLNNRVLAGSPGYRPERLTELLREICVADSVAFVDLYAPFRAAGADSLYFRVTDDHWNDAGQRLAAREVAAALAPVISARTR